MKLKTIVFLLAGLAAGVAGAKPVLWYHFNEKANGQLADISTVGAVKDASGNGLDATPYGIQWNTTNLNSTKHLYYTNSFATAANGVTWVDPVSGTSGTDNRGLYYTCSKPNGAGEAGVVVAPDDAKLHLPQFTVEFFVRFHPDGGDGTSAFKNQTPFIQLHNTPTNMVAWQFIVKTNGVMQLYANPLGKSGKVLVASNLDVVNVVDGRWHHVAATYTGSKCALFVDYVNHGSAAATIAYAEDPAEASLSIGGNSRSTYGRNIGWLDEFRISDEVLTPERFLRFGPVGGDGDTLLYVPGDATRNEFGADASENLNVVTGPGVGKAKAVLQTMTDGRLPESCAETVGAELKGSLFSSDTYANDGALLFATNQTANRTGFVLVDDRANSKHSLLTNAEFTVEFFAKMSESAPAQNRFLWSAHTSNGGKNDGTHYVAARKSDGKFEFRIQQADGAGVAQHVSDIANAFDGQWHHVAVVYDGSTRSAHVYVDYVLSKTWADVALDLAQYSGNYQKGLQFGMGYNLTQNSSHMGWMDEIRFTKRALFPREFLTTHAVPTHDKVAGHQVLFYVPLDGDTKSYPFEDSPAASVSGFSFDTEDRPLEAIAAREVMGFDATNKAAVAGMPGGMIFADRSYLSDVESLTVEFYAKANASQEHSFMPIVRYEGTGIPFQIAKGDGGNLAVMLGNNLTAGKYIQFSNAKLGGGNWHHYAVTIEKKTVENEVKTEVRAYCDHVELPWVSTSQNYLCSGSIGVRGDADKIYLGRAKSWGSLTGCLDEVRIVDGVLAPEDFLDKCPRRGFSFILR